MPKEIVRHPRRPTANESFLTLMPPAAHDVIALVDLLQKCRQLFREMLKIGIHGNDHIADRRIQPGLQSGCLAVVASQLDHMESGLEFGQVARSSEALVAAAIIHEHEFE